jgi:hypothetical protein
VIGTNLFADWCGKELDLKIDELVKSRKPPSPSMGEDWGEGE